MTPSKQVKNKRAAKLTPKDVDFIRSSILSIEELVMKYNMTTQAIKYVLRRRTWHE